MLAGFSQFAALVAERFGIAEVSASSALFRSAIQSWELHTCALMEVKANSALALVRDACQIARGAEAFFTVGLLERGRGRLTQAGRTAHLGPGEFVLCDSRQPFCLEFEEEFHQRLFIVPCALLESRWLASGERTAVAVSARDGIASVPAAMLSVLQEPLGASPRDLALVETHLLEQLSRVFAPAQLFDAHSELSRAALTRATRFIEDNIADQNLSPATVGARLGCSRRYLYKVFEPTGQGVAQFIRYRRVECAQRLLTTPGARSLSMTQVALRVGFANAAGLSRAFREVIGVLPTEYRDLAQEELRPALQAISDP